MSGESKQKTLAKLRYEKELKSIDLKVLEDAYYERPNNYNSLLDVPFEKRYLYISEKYHLGLKKNSINKLKLEIERCDIEIECINDMLLYDQISAKSKAMD